MQTITVPYVIDQLTHSTLWVGVAAFVNFLPALAVGPIAGSLADRFPRKRILLVTQSVMMLVAFSLWALCSPHTATPVIILANLLVSATASGINIASWQSFVPQLVPREDMLNAVRLNSMQFTAARAFGPALAGLVLASLGAADAFLFNALSFVLVLVALLAIHPRGVAAPSDFDRFIDHFRAGLAYVRARRALVLPVVTIVVLSFFGSAVIQLSEPIARHIFHVGAGRYGFMVAAFGGGAILGSMFTIGYGDVTRRSRVTIVGMTAFVVAQIVLGSAPTYGVALAGLAGMGIAYVLCAVSLNTSIQARVDESHRGRVLSIYLMGLLGGVPFGALTQSAIAEAIGLRATVIGAALVLAGFVVVVITRFDALRPLDETLESALDVHTEALLTNQPAATAVE
jgi:MFS family permease